MHGLLILINGQIIFIIHYVVYVLCIVQKFGSCFTFSKMLYPYFFPLTIMILGCNEAWAFEMKSSIPLDFVDAVSHFQARKSLLTSAGSEKLQINNSLLKMGSKLLDFFSENKWSQFEASNVSFKCLTDIKQVNRSLLNQESWALEG